MLRRMCAGVLLAMGLASCGDVGPNTASVATVSVTPATLGLTVGQTGQLTATARDAAGNALSGRAITWVSAAPAVATVDGTGLVTAAAVGAATITATSETKSGTAAVTVSLVPVATVSVTPDHLGLTVGQQGQLTATPRDAGGNPLSGRAITWVSAAPAVATVDGTGLVTAAAVGAATITATSETKSGTAQVTVSPVPVASVTVTPDHLGLTVGQEGQLTATPRDAAGNPLSGRATTWVSDAPAVATVDNTGRVTAGAVGTATITATSETKSGTAAVTVSLVPVATVSVTPDHLDLTVGQQGQLTATPRDAGGNPLSGRAITWVSAAPAVASVDNTGRVTAAAVGTATITATSETKSGTAQVTVSPVPVASVTVTPDHLGLTVGQQGQLTATPRDAAGNPLSGRAITWVSDAPAVATVDNTGRVTAAVVGTATITATSETKSGTAQVTVSPLPVASVTVTPDHLDLTVGQQGQLTATPRDAAGNPLSGRAVSWGSLAPSVATVDATGLVTAVATGTTTVSATSEGKSGMATVHVHEQLTGLDFPGNVAVTTTMRFEFTSPFAAYPATYIWRAYPREQAGYYTSFFHANNDSYFNNQLEYYGFHPYPEPPPPLVGIQKWEISVDGGNDITGDPVVFDRWYLQVVVVSKTISNTRHTYYWDWPDTTHKIVWTGALYAAAPNPAIMVGDNPWNPGEEVYDGVLRGFQFYDVALTPSEIAQEIAAPGSVRRPWYLNLNPTPTDISDKSGSGHDPLWVGNLRPTLWTGIGP